MLIEVERARAADAAAAALLLPMTRHENITSEIVLAWASDRATGARSRHVVAAGVVWAVASNDAPFTVPCALEVAPSYRGKGIGSRLVRALEAEAKEWGAGGLCSPRLVAADSPQADGWRRLKFEIGERFRTYEAATDAMVASHAATYERCRASGRIPGNAVVCEPTESEWAEVAKLSSAHLGGRAWAQLPGMLQTAQKPGYHCRIVKQGDTVAGFLSGHATSEGAFHVDLNVVAPAFRRGWPQMMLHCEFFDAVRKLGYDRTTYDAGNAHPVTHSTAERSSAKLIAEKLSFLRVF